MLIYMVKLFSTKVTRPLNRGKMIFSTNDARKTTYPHVKE